LLYVYVCWKGYGVIRDIYLAVAWNPSRYIVVTQGRVWNGRLLPPPPILHRFALNRDCIREVTDCFLAMGNSSLCRPCVYRCDVITAVLIQGVRSQ
jgi:hypothetical protein